ncbi:hypothetical protein G6F37_008468 [Rhizopus arrhizus]|nr:hypothetical protein G6F38_005535 [Rhizopus arrhizus]KAG1155523.1 hypothetical protein G6F37_008468 [Rhizopus arrhizus]
MPSKSENDSFELYEKITQTMTSNPVQQLEKEKSGSQKRLKGKGKVTDSEVTTTSSTGISTINEPTVFSKITLKDYDLEYSSDDFDAPAVKRPFLVNQSSLLSKPVSTAFNSVAASVKSSFCPVPVDKSSDIKESPKEISKRVMTIKTAVKNIWKPTYLQPLYDLFDTTNLLVTHIFAFTKYIYLQELTANENFALNNFVTKWLISKYKEACFEDARYNPQNLPYVQQIVLYKCTKIQTAYYNNIKAHLGNRLRGLINKLFKKKEKVESLRGEMQAYKSSNKVIKEAIRKKIYQPYDQSRTQLNSFLSSYPEDYTFQENSIYYGVMASPKKHFKVFFRLAELPEAEQTKQLACFPLRTTFIPYYMTLDRSRFEAWSAVVDLNKKAFKHQGFQKSLRFQGTLETDGVGVSIIKQNTDTSRKPPKPNTERKWTVIKQSILKD